MHSLNCGLLFFGLSSLAFAQTPANGGESEPILGPEQTDTPSMPSPTPHENDLAEPQGGAIEPTAAGEIGVNPVDLPPASYVPSVVLEAEGFELIRWQARAHRRRHPVPNSGGRVDKVDRRRRVVLGLCYRRCGTAGRHRPSHRQGLSSIGRGGRRRRDRP